MTNCEIFIIIYESKLYMLIILIIVKIVYVNNINIYNIILCIVCIYAANIDKKTPKNVQRSPCLDLLVTCQTFILLAN